MSSLPHSARPSDFYPDYFKTDLGIGTEKAAPLASFLDDVATNWMNHAGFLALSINPRFFSAQRQRELLARWGFHLDSLEDETVSGIYQEIAALTSQRDSLEAITRLAQLHFPDDVPEIRRGRPDKGSRLDGKIPFPLVLGDADSVNALLHIRFTENQPASRVQSFVANVEALTSTELTVTISLPNGPKAPRPIFRLGNHEPFFARRL